ncbi:MAG: hypothetical protein N4A63_11995 [Vallitalea sp.]|jgi:hypothetical protein|nr:hypothetical protein [Vallitalea sp.]
MKFYIIFILCGFIYGVFVAILFCQITNKKRNIASFGMGCIISTFLAVYNIFTDEISLNKTDMFVWFIVFFIVGFILCFIIYIYSLNIQEDRNYKVKPIDILMNNYNILEAQFNDMKVEIENRNEIKNKELLEKEKDIQIAKQELRELDKKIKDQIRQGIYINNNKEIPVTQYFIDRLPEYVENLVNYIIELNNKTDMFIKNYDNHRNSQQQFLQGYMYAMAVITCKVLFDTNKDVNVCIEFLGDLDNNKVCTDIDKTDSIYKVTGDKAMFVREEVDINDNSFNSEKSNWEDILVIEFKKVNIIKMEIRIRNSTKYKEFTCFLKYCKIDQIIQYFILELFNECNITNKREANNG